MLALAPVLLYPKPVTRWLLLLLPVLWVVRRLAWGHWSVRIPYDNALVCFLLLLPLALLPVTDWSLAVPKLFGLALGWSLVYALANAIDTRRRLHWGIALVLVGYGSAMVAIGLFATDLPNQKLLALGAIRDHLPLLARSLVHGTANGAINPDETGGAITPLVPLTGALFVAAAGGARIGKRLLALAYALLAALLLFTLLLTQSRSAYAGTAVGSFAVIIWLLAVRPRRRGARRVGAVVCLVLAAAAAATAWRVAQALLRGSSIHLQVLQRLELWSRGLDMLQDFPFTGVGLAQFQQVLRALYPPFLNPPNAYLPHAHDFLLQLALDFGIPGAVNIVVMFGLFLRALYWSYLSTDDATLRAACVGLAAGLLAFLTYGLTDAITLGAHGALGLWIFLGLGAAIWRVSAASAGQGGQDSGTEATEEALPAEAEHAPDLAAQ